jgi:carboxyl-terminal processing protease
MPVARRLSLFDRERGALKLTISKFYRVNGDSTQNKGVVSDVVLPSLLNHRDIGEDSLDNALAFDRIERAGYLPFTTYRNDTIVSELVSRSSGRVKENADFQKVQRNIDRYLERKNRKTISLNEEVIKKEEEELKREQEEEKEAIERATGSDKEKELFPDDFYNRELMQITLDYMELRENLRTVRR